MDIRTYKITINKLIGYGMGIRTEIDWSTCENLIFDKKIIQFGETRIKYLMKIKVNYILFLKMYLTFVYNYMVYINTYLHI